MSKTQFATYDEIMHQTEAWGEAVELIRSVELPSADEYNQILFTGCGSTYYLSLAAAALYQELSGSVAKAVPASELLFNPESCLTNQRTLLVAVSRSGTTTETVRAVEMFKRVRKESIVTISNYDQDLSQLGDVNIVISSGQEQSVAQTRSYASMYVAAVGFCSRMSGRPDLMESMEQLPGVGKRLLQTYEQDARRLGENLAADRFYFLGSGMQYGLACEASLKMKEMTLTHSEPFHFFEFRHGPMSMVNENAVVIGLVSSKNNLHEKAVLEEMRGLGGSVISIGEEDVDFPFLSGLPEAVRAVLYLPVLQMMAFYRSVAKNYNPDRPNNLEAVVVLDL